jgi:hypothetical protein
LEIWRGHSEPQVMRMMLVTIKSLTIIMRLYSNSTLYYSYKVFAFSFSIVFSIIGILELWFTELTSSAIVSAMVLSIISIILFLFVYKMNRNFVQVALSKECLIVLNRSVKIPWNEIKSIRFRWFGLYSVKTDSEEYLFTPSDIGLNIFGYRIFTNDLDDFLNHKKKALGLGS